MQISNKIYIRFRLKHCKILKFIQKKFLTNSAKDGKIIERV